MALKAFRKQNKISFDDKKKQVPKSKKRGALKALTVTAVAGAGIFTEEMYRYIFTRNGSKLIDFFYVPKGHDDDYYTIRDQAADNMGKAYRE